MKAAEAEQVLYQYLFVDSKNEHLNQDCLHFYSEVVLTLIFSFISEFPREAKKNKTGKGRKTSALMSSPLWIQNLIPANGTDPQP